MSRGKYLSLEEARKEGKIEQFCKEHPAIGDEEVFDNLLDAIAKHKPPKKPRNSREGGET